jgi:hypothetical protein
LKESVRPQLFLRSQQGLARNSADFASSAAHSGRVEVDGWAVIGEISPLISQFEVAPSGAFQSRNP